MPSGPHDNRSASASVASWLAQLQCLIETLGLRPVRTYAPDRRSPAARADEADQVAGRALGASFRRPLGQAVWAHKDRVPACGSPVNGLV